MATPYGDFRPVGSDTIHSSIAHGNAYAAAARTTFVQETTGFTHEAGSPHRTPRRATGGESARDERRRRCNQNARQKSREPERGQQACTDQNRHRQRLDDGAPVPLQARQPQGVDEADGERHQRGYEPHHAVARNEPGEQSRGDTGRRTDQNPSRTPNPLAHPEAEPDAHGEAASGGQQHVAVHPGDRIGERNDDDPERGRRPVERATPPGAALRSTREHTVVLFATCRCAADGSTDARLARAMQKTGRWPAFSACWTRHALSIGFRGALRRATRSSCGRIEMDDGHDSCSRAAARMTM